MIYLSAGELLRVAERVVPGGLTVRDAGLLDAAALRPQATVGALDAYPDLITKAAALLHSLARSHTLLDGNKRLALGGLIVFLGVNGVCLEATNDDAYDLVVSVATGDPDDVPSIADRLRSLTTSVRQPRAAAQIRQPDTQVHPPPARTG